MSNTGVAILNKTGLRKSQAALYKLLIDKINNGEAVSYDEAENLWLEYVAKIEAGRPHRWDYSVPIQDAAGKLVHWTSRFVPMTDEEIRFSVLNWLTRNIGLLVIKGYLKVIPMVEVAAIEEISK